MWFVVPQSICFEPLVTVITGFDSLVVTNFSLILTDVGFASCDLTYFIQILYSVYIFLKD